MAQEQQQNPSPQPSLIARVLGGRIAQAIGIFGIAFTVFQGLEPFLKFSRFMSYLVSHWRDLTRDLWSWLASFVKLDAPSWVWDLLTLIVFIMLFTIRATMQAHHKDLQVHYKEKVPLAFRMFSALNRYMRNHERSLSSLPIVLVKGMMAVVATLAWTLAIIIVPLAAYVVLYENIGYWALLAAGWFVPLYLFVSVFMMSKTKKDVDIAIIANSERSMLMLAGLLIVNYVGLHAREVGAFFERAIQ